ncbi:MAG: PD-(D/E)XK nuclease family protein [Candidatus Pacearchaeota archaeon]
MVVYSHSRLSTFEKCPYQYKLKYVDRIKPEIPETIENFMGKRVHETLEKLYKDKKDFKRISKSMILKYYKDLWDKEFSENILIAREDMNAENYKKKGLKFIEDYYDKYKPFDQLTILGLETDDRMTLPDGNQWYVKIDKLACDKEGNYYVCDYKTNKDMKTQEEVDSDRQLALYSTWVKDKFPDAKSVKLVWHMLAFNKEAVSERSEEQLQKLQEEVCNKIKEIESATEFPRNQTGLCSYCVYKEMCPSFKHQIELDAKEDVKEFKEDDGLKLVDTFSELKSKLRELQEQEEKIKAEMIEFSKQKGIDIVYGSNMKASVKDLKKVVLPEEKSEIIELLKKKGVWEEFVMLNYSRFNAQGRKGELDSEIMQKIEMGEDWRITLSKRKDVEEE